VVPPFQVLGIDVLLDTHCHPHLLEINSNPSLNIHHEAKDEHG
jgi:D-alanine-D-alanine ligase-like ATP-grasp enzyme